MVPIKEKRTCAITQIPRKVHAYCGAPGEHETGTCIVTMQHGAGYPPQATCKSVVEALTTANNVHGEDVGSHEMGGHRRAREAGGAAHWRKWQHYGGCEAGYDVGRCQSQHSGGAGCTAKYERPVKNTRGVVHADGM